MLTRRLTLLGIAAVVLGACSSSGATTASTPAPATTAAATTSAAPTTAAPTTAAPTTAAPVAGASTTAVVNSGTVALVSSALVAKTGGKLAAADATCIATGLLAKYDLTQLSAMQSGVVPADVAAATAVVIEGCVGAERTAEVGAMLTAS